MSETIHNEQEIEKSFDGNIMKRLLKYARPQIALLLLSIILMLFVTVVDLAIPFVTKVAIDDYIAPTQQVVYTDNSNIIVPTLLDRIKGTYNKEMYTPAILYTEEGNTYMIVGMNKTKSLKDFITRVNRIRRENLALQSDLNLRFHSVDNEQLICYSKRTEDFSNIILAVVNLDYRFKQSGWVNLSLEELGLKSNQPYEVRDLLPGATYQWQGSRNYVELDPQKIPVHIFRVNQTVTKK